MKNNETPLVSIYVATYNQEKYLRDCLDGIVMQQTSFAIEAIVIDDASTDSNPQIILEYAKRYPNIIRPVLLKENYYQQNRSKIFEIFFPMARGKYMAFCEGDDYWTFPGKLQAQVDFLETHPSYSMCFHNYKLINISNFIEKSYCVKLFRSCKVSTSELILHQLAQTATIVARISNIKNDTELLEFSKNMTYKFTDMRFLLSYANSGKVYGFANDWSVYRVNNQGISTIALKEKKDKFIHNLILEDLYTCYNNKFKYLKNYFHTTTLLTHSSLLFSNRKYYSALKLKFKAFLSSPRYFIKLYTNQYIYIRIKHYACDFNNNNSI